MKKQHILHITTKTDNGPWEYRVFVDSFDMDGIRGDYLSHDGNLLKGGMFPWDTIVSIRPVVQQSTEEPQSMTFPLQGITKETERTETGKMDTRELNKAWEALSDLMVSVNNLEAKLIQREGELEAMAIGGLGNTTNGPDLGGTLGLGGIDVGLGSHCGLGALKSRARTDPSPRTKGPHRAMLFCVDGPSPLGTPSPRGWVPRVTDNRANRDWVRGCSTSRGADGVVNPGQLSKEDLPTYPPRPRHSSRLKG